MRFTTKAGANDMRRSDDSACRGLTQYRVYRLDRQTALTLVLIFVMVVIREVAEKYINHVSGVHSGVNAIYDRYSFMDEMREVVRKWEAQLQALTND